MRVNGFYPSAYICNQLPVIKPLASAAVHDIIGDFHEIHLNLLLQRKMTVPKQLTRLLSYDY